MRNMHDFITLSMANIDWTIKILNPINIWEFVEGKSPYEVTKVNSQNTHKGSMQHDSRNMVLLC